MQTCLSGEVLALVVNPSLDSSNSNKIWETLTKRYDNKLDLVNNASKQLVFFEMKPSYQLTSLKRLRDVIFTSVTTLKSIDRLVNTWNDILVYLISEKLDKVTRECWDNKVVETGELPTLKDFLQFLDVRIRVNSNKKGSDPKHNVSSKSTIHSHQTSPVSVKSQNELREEFSVPSHSKSRAFSLTSSETDPFDSNTEKLSFATNKSKSLSKAKRFTFCYFCESNAHSITHCEKFRALSINERVSFVQTSYLCLNCLGKHAISQCTTERRCLTCGKAHHTQLHGGFASATEGVSVHLSSGSSEQSMLLATAKVLVTAPSGRTVIARAILDPCSECSIVSENLAQILRLERRQAEAKISGINGSTTGRAISAVQFRLSSNGSTSEVVDVSASVLPKVTTYESPQM